MVTLCTTKFNIKQIHPFCPQSELTCFVRMSEQTTIISLLKIRLRGL